MQDLQLLILIVVNTGPLVSMHGIKNSIMWNFGLTAMVTCSSLVWLARPSSHHTKEKGPAKVTYKI